MNKYLLLLLLLQTLTTFSQENIGFKTFGFKPKHVPNYLYEDLKNAQTDIEKLSVLDTIASIYLLRDSADSLTYYGLKMRDLITTKTPTSYDFLAFYYSGLGKQREGLLDGSIEQYLQGLSWPLIETYGKQRLTLSLARTYFIKSDMDKTKKILDTLALKINSPDLKADLEILEGDYDFQKSAFAKAKKHYNNVIKISQDSSYLKKELTANIGKAKILIKENQIEEALSIFIETKSKALNAQYYDIYIKAILYEGRIYGSVKNYLPAEMALSSAYANTIQWNRKKLQQQVLSELARLYAAKGDFENAYNLTTQNEGIIKQIASEQNEKEVRDLEIRYETLQKEKTITSLEVEQLVKEEEIKKQKTIKNVILIGFLILLIPIISFLVVYYQKLQAQSKLNAQQKKINEQEVTSLLQTQQLELAKASIQAQNEERSRIARELHDSIGGNLGAIKLQMSRDKENIDALIMEQLDKTYEQVREISHSLVPKEFSEQTFTDLVERYISNFSKGQSFEVIFASLNSDGINSISERLQVSIFNMIKELLNNAYKYAQASQIDVQLNYDEDQKSLDLLYEDNGRGFDTTETSNGIGLNNLSKRDKEYNGTMHINTAINRGTVISISLQNNTETNG